MLVCVYICMYIYRLLCRFADRWRLRACLADFNKLLTLALCRTRGSAGGRVAACVAQTNTQAYIHTTHCYLPHTQTHTHTHQRPIYMQPIASRGVTLMIARKKVLKGKKRKAENYEQGFAARCTYPVIVK